MNGICDGRVVAITGAGRGLGREYALEFARQGARVVVNDLGGESDGGGSSAGPAQQVVDEIEAMGGAAVANTDDIADFDGAKRFVESAISSFGRLDTLVNNAGILRDRTIVNMSIEEWDSVIRVHLRGTFSPTRWAGEYWRERSKAGDQIDARLINTCSSSGLYANPGQANYAAAKSGIATFTVVASRELARYGVLANAIYPTALSRLTEEVFAKAGLTDEAVAEGEFSPFDAANVAPAVVWLGSSRSTGITGQVFGVRGGSIVVAENWRPGPSAEVDRRWDPAELDEIIPDLVARSTEALTPASSRSAE
ncbi:SDR family oxidoreductase [Ilumatobacter nonamiensis]|uniref:SDR family oxidoreductase n=1 Tax=Ilumatobacter nonamiensis TaxID=467093 RepID=UPI000590ABBA|nr:SDR family oxidoreductase [Ilumatobacter nonamiensis]